MEKNEAIRQWAVDMVLRLTMYNSFKNIKIADIIKEAKELEKYIITKYLA